MRCQMNMDGSPYWTKDGIMSGKRSIPFYVLKLMQSFLWLLHEFSIYLKTFKKCRTQIICRHIAGQSIVVCECPAGCETLGHYGHRMLKSEMLTVGKKIASMSFYKTNQAALKAVKYYIKCLEKCLNSNEWKGQSGQGSRLYHHHVCLHFTIKFDFWFNFWDRQFNEHSWSTNRLVKF